MRKICLLARLLATLLAMTLGMRDARAADIPIEVFSNWKIYNDAGWNFLNKGEYDKAEKRFRMAIEEVRPYVRDDPRLLARSCADLARVFYHQGRYADAEPLAKWALSVRESNPKVSPDQVFQSLYTLAMIHVAQEHFDQAEPLLRRALELQEKAIGPSHVQTTSTVDELANVLGEQRKFPEAERLYQRAIANYLRFNPDENLELAACAEHYSKMLKRMGRDADSRKTQDRADAIRNTVEKKAALSRDTEPRTEYKGFK